MSRNPCLLWNPSLHSLTRSLRSLRAAARSTSFIVVASSLQKIELWYPNFGLQAIDCDHATAESQRRIVEDQLLDAFSRRGLEAGLPAFQLPMVGKCDILPKRYVRQTCWRHLFPPFPLNSKHPIPKRSLRFLRAAVRSTSSALCLHLSHPFVAATEKRNCLMQRRKAFGHAVAVSKIL